MSKFMCLYITYVVFRPLTIVIRMNLLLENLSIIPKKVKPQAPTPKVKLYGIVSFSSISRDKFA